MNSKIIEFLKQLTEWGTFHKIIKKNVFIYYKVNHFNYRRKHKIAYFLIYRYKFNEN